MDAWDRIIIQQCDRAEKLTNDVLRNSLIELYSRIVYRTPVGDPALWHHPAPAGYLPGALRGGWAYQAGEAPPPARTLLDTDGSATIEAIRSAMPDVMVGKVHFLANYTPYVQEIEYNAHSSQAPAGMVGVSVMEFEAIINGQQLRAAGF